MSKKSGVFDVQSDSIRDSVFTIEPDANRKVSITIEKALVTIIRQMQVSGLRPRTISDYNLHMTHFSEITKVKYVDDITTSSIYEWLESMKVADTTKLIRLKCLKAILGRFFDNGWIESKFWKSINIKISKNVKKGSTVNDINILLSLLDLNSFVGLRDAVAILTLFKTGVRINTLGQLEEKHIDFDKMVLNLDGAILKNHKFLILPIDKQMVDLLRVLIEQNKKVRKHYKQTNRFIFISIRGTGLTTKSTNNAISKRLHSYAEKYDLENINPHAIRRGYATQLLNKGASVALISKALGHSNLAVTTQYLDLDQEEVATNLRDFL